MTNIEKALNKYANIDLNSARTKGEISIVNMKAGNISIQYTNGQYMIVPLLDRSYAHYVGRKAGALAWLKANYQVVGE